MSRTPWLVRILTGAILVLAFLFPTAAALAQSTSPTRTAVQKLPRKPVLPVRYRKVVLPMRHAGELYFLPRRRCRSNR